MYMREEGAAAFERTAIKSRQDTNETRSRDPETRNERRTHENGIDSAEGVGRLLLWSLE